ncbi:MAG TPA: hypothetical protein VGD45_27205 [Steroidobacter sp.]|uniref:hypothetical protein n=1 Tax=Steroidobacter sp. TaxID=1978227 RepID=UPI002ED867A9
MKKLFVLALGILALVPVVSGTMVPADASATSMAQTTDLTPELAQALQAQASSGSLSRPL